MRQAVRKLLNFVILVVAFSAAGINGYASALAACHGHTPGGHASVSGLHHHASVVLDSHADHGDEGASDVTDATSPQDTPSSSDRLCTHGHVHCCASFAVTASDCTFALMDHVRTTPPIALAHIPAGQLATPLFRPPRLAA